MSPSLTHGSLFTGIGGFDLAFASVGIPTLWMVENDEFCRAILRKNFGDVGLFGDIRECGGHNLCRVDIVSGGFPCQGNSCAGKRKGSRDPRFLWPEMFRVICELRPRWIVAENVRGLLSVTSGRDFEQICSDMENEGYEVLPLVLPACAYGAPHHRDRVFIIAHADDKGAGQRIEQQACAEKEGAMGAADVADAAGFGRRWHHGEDGKPQRGEQEEGGMDAHRCGPHVPDAEGARCQRGFSGRDVAAYPFVGGDSWWESEPPVGRVADGVPHRSHQLKALGNSIVPACAAWIAQRIVWYEAGTGCRDDCLVAVMVNANPLAE
jgi:DNA (cytosine-5)-methyltransferase 1